MSIYTAVPPDAFESIGTRLELLATGWVAVGLTILALAVLAIGEALCADDGHYITAWLLGIFAGIVAIVWACMMIPYQSTYQRVYRVTGHVESMTNALSEEGGELTRTPIAVLDTVDRPIAIDDPRATMLEGRDVTLTCTIGWHYRAADTYTCAIYDIQDPS